ncbi:MAG: ethanolamine ammonia-lyase light chain EutC, partial [Mycolicibacterium frederiksbergense]|nr:ethanolamine ammonia-lyase light chain EutC [Mycolicibacterium frederiksbergense]
NCISNIHPPDGLGYTEAARVATGLIGGAVALGRSGVDLKDTSRSLESLEREVDREIS